MGFMLVQPAPYMFSMRQRRDLKLQPGFTRVPHYVWQVHANVMFDPAVPDPPAPKKPEQGWRIGVVQCVLHCRLQISYTKNGKAVAIPSFVLPGPMLDTGDTKEREFDPFSAPPGFATALGEEVDEAHGFINRSVITGTLSKTGFNQVSGFDPADDDEIIGLHDADIPSWDIPDTLMDGATFASYDQVTTFQAWIVAIPPAKAAKKTIRPDKGKAASPTMTVVAATQPFSIVAWMENKFVGKDIQKDWGLFLVTGDRAPSNEHLATLSENIKKMRKDNGATVAFTQAGPETPGPPKQALTSDKRINDELRAWKYGHFN